MLSPNVFRPRSLVQSTGPVGLFLGPAIALAHPGHGVYTPSDFSAIATFSTGFLHPFTGLDHLALLIIVGLWAGLLKRTAHGLMSLGVFSWLMLMGCLLAVINPHLPMVDALIWGSTLMAALALAIPRNPRFSFLLAGVVMAAAALCHGYSHAATLPQLVGPSYFGGILLSSLAITTATACFTRSVRALLKNTKTSTVTLRNGLFEEEGTEV